MSKKVVTGERVVHVRSGKILSQRLGRFIRGCEKRYEMTSGEARIAIKAGRLPETSETAKWMQADLVKGRLANMNGTRSKTIGTSMRKFSKNTHSSKVIRS